MIIPARKQFRWRVWLMGYAIILVIVFFLSVGAYRIMRNARSSPTPIEHMLTSVLPKELLPFRSTPTPTPVTPQKTSEFFRGAYVRLEKNTLELKGTAGTTEKIQIGDHTEFTCTPRFIRDANGIAVDMTNMLLSVKPGSNYTTRSSSPTFLGRTIFEGAVKPGDTLLVTLGPSTDDLSAIRVSLMTDPCNPDKWKL